MQVILEKVLVKVLDVGGNSWDYNSVIPGTQ